MKDGIEYSAAAAAGGGPCVPGLYPAELAAWLGERGQPAFRARQILDWVWRKGVTAPARMTNLPPGLRAELAAADFEPVRVLEAAAAPGDETRKVLGELADGERIETVWIPAGARRTVCVSTQVGCAYGCAFCASGQGGLRRDLTAGEITGQVCAVRQVTGAGPTHVVFMGIGEPLANYDATLRAVRILNDPAAGGIGARRITLSTCGLPPAIERLAGEGLQFELSVSLHALEDELRARLMPVNRRYPVETLLRACAAYTARTRRIITFEYTLVAGLNDHVDQADALGRRLKQFPCRVNLIPLSPVAEFDGQPPSLDGQRAFLARLERAGVQTTLRLSRGAGLAAACGQLRAARAR